MPLKLKPKVEAALGGSASQLAHSLEELRAESASELSAGSAFHLRKVLECLVVEVVQPEEP